MPAVMEIMPLAARQQLTANNITSMGDAWISTTGTKFRGYQLAPDTLAVSTDTAITIGAVVSKHPASTPYMITDTNLNDALELKIEKVLIFSKILRINETTRDTFGRPVLTETVVATAIPIISKQPLAPSTANQPDQLAVVGDANLISNMDFKILAKDMLQLSSGDTYRVERVTTVNNLQQLYVTLI